MLRRDIGTIQDAGQLHEHVLNVFRPAADVGRPQTQRVCLQRQTGDQPPAVGEFLSDAHEFQVVHSHVGRVPGNGKRLAHRSARRDHDPAGLRSPASCTGRPRHAHGERRTLRKAHAHLDPPSVGAIPFPDALHCRDEPEGSARVPIQQQRVQTIQADERARWQRPQVIAVHPKYSHVAQACEYSLRQRPQPIVVHPNGFQTDQPGEHPGGQRREAVVV